MDALIDGSQYIGLNVGSGPHYADGWCNTDILPAPKGTRDPDVLADIFDYGKTFKPESFKKAYIGHVLEHIPLELTILAVQHIAATVQTGGQVMAVGPCIDKAVATNQPGTLLKAIRHNPNEPQHPWSHAWTPTEQQTLDIMDAAGFVEVRVVPIGSVIKPEWPNPSTAEWQTAVVGVI